MALALDALLTGATLATLLISSTLPANAQSCQARSTERQTMLVELYTSEGCNSCPPADRWLSTLNARPDLLAAAFHVDYWDRLGWADRFASPQHSQRQAAQQRHSGAGFSYTPQVMVNGRDWRGAPTLPIQDARAPVLIELRRLDERQVAVSISAQRGAPAKLALWWALLEDGHVSNVGAGENHGVTLKHDHVVRQYGQQPAWGAAAGDHPVHELRLVAAANGEGGRKARLLVVVTDAATGAPLQATQLGC